jgi:hypothetical protein
VNQLYPAAYQAFLNGSISWSRHRIFAAPITDTFNPADEFVGDLGGWVDRAVAGEGRGAPVVAELTGKTSTGGVADATDVVFLEIGVYDPSLEPPPTAVAVAVFQNLQTGPIFTSDDFQSRLIGYIDTAIGLPMQLNGGDVFVSWHNGLNRIFAL